MTSPLVGYFVEEKHFWVGIGTSTFDALISCLIDKALQFAFEVLGVAKHFFFVGLAFALVKGDQPMGVDALLEVVMNEVSDATPEALGLVHF